MSSTIFKKVFPSIFLGSALAAGPFAISTSSSLISGSNMAPIKQEDKGFGKLCYLTEEKCNIIDDHEGHSEDVETISQEDQKYQSEYWKAQKDDFCGWGFPEEWGLNTYLDCKNYQLEKNKKAQE